MEDVAALTHSQFTQNLHGSFRLHIDAESTVDLELIEVSGLVETPRQEGFSVFFRGPLDFCLPQQLYRIDHEHIGSHELFLVPVGQEKEGFIYQTVFNRLKD